MYIPFLYCSDFVPTILILQESGFIGELKMATILRSNSHNAYKKADSAHVIQSGRGPPTTGNSQNIFAIAKKSKGMWIQTLFHVYTLLIWKKCHETLMP